MYGRVVRISLINVTHEAKGYLAVYCNCNVRKALNGGGIFKFH